MPGPYLIEFFRVCMSSTFFWTDIRQFCGTATHCMALGMEAAILHLEATIII